MGDMAFEYKLREFTVEEYHRLAEVGVLRDSPTPQMRKDAGPKLCLCARFGIPDYVVVDLERDVVTHYSEPHELGYRRERNLERHETFTLQRIAGVALSAAPFLTPPSP